MTTAAIFILFNVWKKNIRWNFPRRKFDWDEFTRENSVGKIFLVPKTQTFVWSPTSFLFLLQWFYSFLSFYHKFWKNCMGFSGFAFCFRDTTSRKGVKEKKSPLPFFKIALTHILSYLKIVLPKSENIWTLYETYYNLFSKKLNSTFNSKNTSFTDICHL